MNGQGLAKLANSYPQVSCGHGSLLETIKGGLDEELKYSILEFSSNLESFSSVLLW